MRLPIVNVGTTQGSFAQANVSAPALSPLPMLLPLWAFVVVAYACGMARSKR